MCRTHSAFSTLIYHALIDRENTADSSSNALPHVLDRIVAFGKDDSVRCPNTDPVLTSKTYDRENLHRNCNSQLRRDRPLMRRYSPCRHNCGCANTQYDPINRPSWQNVHRAT